MFPQSEIGLMFIVSGQDKVKLDQITLSDRHSTQLGCHSREKE